MRNIPDHRPTPQRKDRQGNDTGGGIFILLKSNLTSLELTQLTDYRTNCKLIVKIKTQPC